ncbi:MAG: cytoskeleton protein RodZ [Chloroflexota bacterium]|nr:cytoskeleton protein RodZ [Chloroflexota bacterium]
MTARHQIRVGGRLGRGRSPIDATPAPSVGETLTAARERKGVDLHRAERDTKIRAKHLAALESGDYTELPGEVYTRGFLRNYAAYLGLDADEILEDWREEQDANAPRVREPLALPPQPLVEPKGHLRFTRGVFVGALLILVVVGFLGYLGVQLLRFSHPPTLSLDAPLVQTLAPDSQSYTFAGKVDMPAAIITVTGPSSFLQTTDALQDGTWQMQVPVMKGINDFTIRARDPQIPDPDRGSAPLSVRLTVPIPATPSPVPLPSASGGPLPSSGGTPLPLAQVALSQPAERATFPNGPVAVSGTSNATSVTVSATYVGPPGVEAPSPAPSAAPNGSPGASPPAGPSAPSVQLTVTNGTFSGSISLTAGRWMVVATANEVPGSLGAAASPPVTVDITANDRLVLEIKSRLGFAWIRVIVDGQTVEPGHTWRPGETQTFTGKDTIDVLTGNAGVTAYTLNGRSLGTLGNEGEAGTWRFEKDKAPRRI